MGPGDTDFEIQRDYADAFMATVDRLTAKGYAEDLIAPYPALRESGSVTRNYRNGFLGVRVTALDSHGSTWMHLTTYAGCPMGEVVEGDKLEDSVADLLAAKDQEIFTCQSLRALVPAVEYLPASVKELPGFLDAYRPIAEDPKELLAAFATARAEGRKDIVVKRPETFDDPAFEGKRGALKALFKTPPAIVTIGGKPFGLFGKVDTSDSSDDAKRYVRYMWVTALDALHIVDPPSAEKPSKPVKKKS